MEIQYEDVWTPRIKILNSYNQNDFPDTCVLLRENGRAEMNIPGMVTIGCHMDMTHYPYDTQVCVNKRHYIQISKLCIIIT